MEAKTTPDDPMVIITVLHPISSNFSTAILASLKKTYENLEKFLINLNYFAVGIGSPVISSASNSLTQKIVGNVKSSLHKFFWPGAAFRMEIPLNSSRALIVAGMGVSS